MAGEILVLQTIPQGDGGRESYRALFFFRVSPLIQVGNIVVVPTPSNTLPSEVDEFQLLDASQKAVFDNGNYVFREVTVHRNPGETEAQMLDKVKRKWTAMNARVVPDLRRQYQRTGLTVDI